MLEAGKTSRVAWAFAFALLAGLVLPNGPVLADPVIKSQQEPAQTQEIPQLRPQANHHPSGSKIPRSQVVEIPRQFLGCWHGAVGQEQLTNLELLSPPRIDVWLTKNYRVCFIRQGDELRVTIADSNVDQHDQVLRATSTLEPVTASGNQVELDGYLTLIERSSNLFGLAEHPPTVVLERVKLRGELREDNAMAVQGQVTGYYNGRPWWIGQWRCNFERQP